MTFDALNPVPPVTSRRRRRSLRDIFFAMTKEKQRSLIRRFSKTKELNLPIKINGDVIGSLRRRDLYAQCRRHARTFHTAKKP